MLQCPSSRCWSGFRSSPPLPAGPICGFAPGGSPLAGVVLVFGSSLVLTVALPALFQVVFVKPNELQLEKPYIQSNIDLTQQAYNLHQILVKPFPVEQSLTFQTLQANQAT